MRTGKIDFVGQMAKIMPRMLREIARKQQGILTKGNLAFSDIVVLDALLEKGDCTMGFLANILNLTTSAVTVIIDKMTKKGFVRRERPQDDRRIVMVKLLKKGKDAIERVNKERGNMVNELYSALNEEERAEYIRMIKKVYDSLSHKK